MMKKWLILMLVLGLASTASAVLISSAQTYYYKMEMSAPGATFDTGDIVTIEIFVGTDATGCGGMVDTVLNISAASSATVAAMSDSGDWSTPPAAPDTNSTIADGSGGYNVNVSGLITAAIPANSSIYTVTFVAGAAGIVTIDANSGNWDNLAAVDGISDGYYTSGAIYGLPYHQLTIVPEPITIALLGLGGLLLGRRKGG